MPPKSSNSVKIYYFNFERVLRQLHLCAKALRKNNKKVESIRLFGSIVRGDYTPGSYAYLLIILTGDTRRWMNRIPEFLHALSEVEIGIDVFPLTHAEIQKAYAENNLFIEQALEQSIELGN